MTSKDVFLGLRIPLKLYELLVNHAREYYGDNVSECGRSLWWQFFDQAEPEISKIAKIPCELVGRDTENKKLYRCYGNPEDRTILKDPKNPHPIVNEDICRICLRKKSQQLEPRASAPQRIKQIEKTVYTEIDTSRTKESRMSYETIEDKRKAYAMMSPSKKEGIVPCSKKNEFRLKVNLDLSECLSCEDQSCKVKSTLKQYQ